MSKGGPRRSGRSPETGRRVEPDPLAEKIGHRIRSLRKEAGFSFIEFVAETELGAGYISELERGLVVPGAGALARVADALGVALCDIVAFPDDDARQRLLDLTRRLDDADIDALVRSAKKDRSKGKT